MEAIEISEGVVHLVERSVVKSISIRSFKESLISTMGFQTPVLPAGTILYGQRDETSVYVLEQAPSRKTVKHKKTVRRTAEVTEYTIPLPWVYFVTQFHSYALEQVYVFFSPEHVQSVADPLCIPPLPNLYDDCKVCMGNDFRFSVTSSLPSKVSQVMGHFWGSQFNEDLPQFYLNKMPREIRQLCAEGEEHFAGWQKLPEDQACRVGWMKYQSLEQVIERVLGKEEDDE